MSAAEDAQFARYDHLPPAEQTRAHLTAALPWTPGTYCSIEYTRPNANFNALMPVHPRHNPEFVMRSERVNSTDEAVATVTRLTKTRNVFDIYFSTAPLTQMKLIEPKPGGKQFTPFEVPLRIKGTEGARTTLVADFDVKPGAYASTEDAMTAMQTFLQATGLPRGSMVVSSGTGGLHYYFNMETPESGEEWQWKADALANVMRKHNLLCDFAVTENAVGLLRVAGTYNYKRFKSTGRELPVSLLAINQTRIPNAVMAAALAPYQTAGKIITRGTASHNPLTEGLEQVINLRNIDEVSRQCGWVADSLDNGGVNNSHDLQRSAARVAMFCEDSEDTLRRMVHNRASIANDPAEIQFIFDQVTAENEDGKWRGFPRCRTIEREGAAACRTCPHTVHKETGGSPLNISTARLRGTQGFWEYKKSSRPSVQNNNAG